METAIWFMYDNHTFTKVAPVDAPRDVIKAELLRLFDIDPYGFVGIKGPLAKEEPLWEIRIDIRGRNDPNYSEKIERFLGQVEERVNWVSRG